MSKLPPAYHHLTKHKLMPEISHDDTSRFNFLISLNKHLSELSKGNKTVYEKNVSSKIGEDSKTNRAMIRNLMNKQSHYQTWSALRRSSMEMRQQAGRSIVLRDIKSLTNNASKLNQDSNCQTDANFVVPNYQTAVDIHCMPGSYHTELCKNDVSAGANYDLGIFVTALGGLGKLSDGGGKALVNYLQKEYPSFKPKRILEIGCTIGHSLLPIAQHFPDAEVIGIDLAAPVIRYASARAKALGIDNVRFIQANGEKLDFDDESFDWIQTTMFLHETSTSAIRKILSECYRCLKPNGLNLHVEQPQYTDDMDIYEKFIRDWDSYYNNEPFWSKMHDMDAKELLTTAGFDEEKFMMFKADSINDFESNDDDDAEDHGRKASWHLFGAWK